MTAIIGAALLMLVIIMSVALILGAPLGEFTLGGQFKVFPTKLRFVLLTQLLLQVFFVAILLQLGHIIPLWFSHKVTSVIGFALAIYLTLNCLANMTSKSKKEKYVMTPLSVVTAYCFWVNALAF
jgi:hypothetical protein